MNHTGTGYISPEPGISIRWGGLRTTARPCRGSILLLSGRGEYLEKHMETATDLNSRGFDVYSFDWRGQGLSSRFLPNRHKGWVRTYDDYMDDLKAFLQTIMKPGARTPFYLLAHSMGGHIGLRFLHDHGRLFQGCVLTAPLIDIAMPACLKRILRIYVRVAVKLGLGKWYAPGAGDNPPKGRRFENNKLTTDRRRFDAMLRQQAENPELALGGVTHQWLLATFDSIDCLGARGLPEKIGTPVLMVAGADDRIVSLAAQKALQKRMPQSRLVILENARHEILVEADGVRRRFWKVFDEFLN